MSIKREGQIHLSLRRDRLPTGSSIQSSRCYRTPGRNRMSPDQLSPCGTEAIQIPNLTIILIVATPRSSSLHLSGVPYVHFPPYTRAESLSIVSKSPLSIFSVSPSSHEQRANGDNDSTWLWARFCTAVWDSLGQGVAPDILSFWEVCERLWKPFVQPVVDGSYGIREFSKLMVKNRVLFQGEAVLMESIIAMDSDSKTHALRSNSSLLNQSRRTYG